MRIVGGEWSGRILKAPKGSQTRPTSDAEREALFNILSHSLGHELRCVLDIFAGTGALSFEAFSRGAETAVLIESDRQAAKVIEANQSSFALASDRLKLLSENRVDRWPRLLKALPQEFFPFDTVFCDPPYRKGLVEKTFRALMAAESLFSSGQTLLICELGSEEARPQLEPFGWQMIKERRRGQTQLVFYRRI